jgi:putative addiction module antidote
VFWDVVLLQQKLFVHRLPNALHAEYVAQTADLTLAVIPAKAGTQTLRCPDLTSSFCSRDFPVWVPAFAGMTEVKTRERSFLLLKYYIRYNNVSTFVIIRPNLEKTMQALKLTQIGNSVGVVLPKEILAQLKLAKGDTVFLTEAANGVMLSPYDPAVEEELNAGREFMKEYRDTFRALAK